MSETRSLHEGRYLSLRERDDWQFASRPNSTGVVGVLAITDDQQIVLVEQYRRPVQARVIEICAGLVGDEEAFAGESLAECANRELIEETGYRAGSIIHLLTSPTSSGMTDEQTHLFLAKDLVRESDGGGVADEDITVHHVPLSEVDQALASWSNQGLQVDFKIHASLWAARKHL